MAMLIETLIIILLITGGLFLLVGSIGLIRLPDFFTRLHAPTKATTLGIGCILIASMLSFSAKQGMLSVHELMITLFLFITAPISAHMLCKAALHQRLRIMEKTRNQQLAALAEARQPPHSADKRP
jgi:multicomponent K+:H+ antiporter subunit G